MSVVGIGNDIVEIVRILDMAEPVRLKLAKRVLTPRELEIFNSIKFPERYLAKRWAGKEAAAKALGTGIAQGVSFQHIDIQSLDTGQPQLVFSDKALEFAQNLGATSWHISLSDEASYATAFVILSR